MIGSEQIYIGGQVVKSCAMQSLEVAGSSMFPNVGVRPRGQHIETQIRDGQGLDGIDTQSLIRTGLSEICI